MRTFSNKVAVITGAGAGIGRALAVALAREGAQLALSDINETGLAETVRQVPAGTRVTTYRLDVADHDEVFAHADLIRDDFGAAHLLFNNAGTTLIGTFENQSIEEMRWLVNINLWGVIYCTKAFLPLMLSQREACIVNFSSVFGLVGYPTHSAYNITKFGVRGFTESLWSELEGTGVRAICVHPGGIRTGFESRLRMSAVAGERERAMERKAASLMRTPPEVCVRDILKGVRRGRRRIVTGRYSGLLYWLPRLFPESYPRLMRPLMP